MSQVASRGMHHTYDSRAETDEPVATGWVGWIGFAGVMMILSGIFQAIAGIIEIFNQGFVAVTNSDQILVLHNIQSWGWVNLIIGAIVFLAGLSLFSGAAWARVIAVIIAAGAAISNLLSIGIYPFWSLIGLTLSVLVIYAVIVHGDELRAHY